jgi:hypothetical protein
MTKKRKNPFEEGKMKEMWQRFFIPLLAYKPEDSHLKQWLEDKIFQIHERPIRQYRVKNPFLMPGLFAVIPNEKIQGLGERKVRKGSRLFVRIEPNGTFQVEDNKEQVFELTLLEWNAIATNLKALDR